MPEGRFLSKSVCVNEQLASVPLEAALLFTWCIPHLDRDGRITGNPTLLKASVCPLRDEIRAGSIPDLLRTLSGANLLKWYEADGKQVLEFPAFARHQKGLKYDREAPSRFKPSTFGDAVDLADKYKSGPTPDEVRTNSGSTPDQVPLKLSKVNVSLSEVNNPPLVPPLPEAKPEPKKPIPRKRTIPDDWHPNETHVRMARDMKLDLQVQEVLFRDYAEANRKLYVSWDAAFRNWLRKAVEFRPAQKQGESAQFQAGDPDADRRAERRLELTRASIDQDRKQVAQEREMVAKVDAWSKRNELRAAAIWDEVVTDVRDDASIPDNMKDGMARVRYRQRVLQLLESAA